MKFCSRLVPSQGAAESSFVSVGMVPSDLRRPVRLWSYGAAGCSCCTGTTPIEVLPGSGEESIEEKLLSGLSLENIVWVDDARSPSLLLEDDEEYEALRHCGKAQFGLRMRIACIERHTVLCILVARHPGGCSAQF